VITAKVVQARLDDETDKILKDLRRRTSLSESELVRRGIRSLAALLPSRGGSQVVGVGRFASGISDLGSDKDHLKGFRRQVTEVLLDRTRSFDYLID
jgi:hypothetical protein